MKVFYTQTPAGKPKIVNGAGFTLAFAADATQASRGDMQRFVALWNAGQLIPLADLEQIASSEALQHALREFTRTLNSKP